MNLTAHLIETPRDVECLRCIRNITRQGYSNHNALVSPSEQAAWWAANQERVRAWLYFEADQHLAGFGLLRLADDGYWRTVVGVLPGFEGRGYGKWITRDIVAKAPGGCRATARRDNPAAVKLHVEDDWRVVEGPDPRLVYFETHDRLAVAAVTRPFDSDVREDCRA